MEPNSNPNYCYRMNPNKSKRTFRQNMGNDHQDHQANRRQSRSREREMNVKPQISRSPSPMNNQPKWNNPHDQEYFARMSKRIHDGFKDDIDKEVFAENIMKQINGTEVQLAMHKQPSICIQWLIENATEPASIKHLIDRFNVQEVGIEFANSQYASHVLQALVESCLKILSKETCKWATQYITDVGKMVVTNMDQLLNDVNGSHVMITIMEALGGIRVGRHWSRKTMGFGKKQNIHNEIEKDIVIKELPQHFKNLLKKFSKQLIIERSDRDLKEVVLGKGTSLIQYLLFVLKVRCPDLCQTVVKRLVDIVFSCAENKFAITTNSVSAYLVEAIMLVSCEHRLIRIWEKHLKGSLKDMWKDDIANFIVQRLIDSAITSDHLFSDICLELLPSLEGIFGYNRPGIGVCLAKACQKFTGMQKNFINALLKAFHCFEPKERQIHLVPLMLFSEDSSGRAYGRKEIWLHGSLMLQYIFGYEDCYKITKSLLSLEKRELVGICNDKSGSHVIDSFLQSQTVAPKHKSMFVEKLRGSYVNLACDRFGSRIIDHLLNTLDPKMKAQIMDELCAKETQLNNSRNGYYVGKKAGLHTYKNRFDDWKDVERVREKKRRTFEEFFEPDQYDDNGRDNGRNNGRFFNKRQKI